ncbi:MAG: DUF2341 domain-containing protein, partial [Verrucomicrobiota bacterium]
MTLTQASALDPLDFNHRMKITFTNYTAGETLVNFPALVRFDAGTSNFYSGLASSSGGDLRFADETQTNALNFEIESFDTNGVSFVWVQVPALTAGSCIYAYWGHLNATNLPAYTTNGAVWTEGYMGVWHLHDTNALGRFTDSTANGRDGANLGTTNVPGLAADARGFDGTAAFIDTEQSFLSGLGMFTLSVFANGIFSDARRGFVGQNDALEYGPNGTVSIWTERGGGLLAGPAVPNSTWHQFVVAGDGSAKRMYVDGVEAASGAGVTADYGDSGAQVHIGGGGVWDGGGNFFNGSLDEVRISSVARSSNWNWAVWNNMMSNDAFNGYGPAEAIDTNLPWLATLSATNITSTNALIQGEVFTNGGSPATIFAYYGTTDGGTNPGAWDNRITVTANPPTPSVVSGVATGLVPDTVYYFRFYATNTFGVQWAYSARQFLSLAPPVVDNEPGPTGIGVGTATLNGRFTGLNVGDATIYWGPTDGADTPTAWSNAVSLGNPGMSAFFTMVTGLTHGVQYYYRAFASNQLGSDWANTSTNFKSALPPTVFLTNGIASSITASSAVIAATFRGTASVFEVFAVWGPNDGGTNRLAWSNRFSFGWFTNAAITNLSTLASGFTTNSTNYFSFYATNCVGEVWGLPATLFHAKGVPVVDNGGGGMTVSNGLNRLDGTLTLGGMADVSIFWGASDGGTNPVQWANRIDLGSSLEGGFSGLANGLLYGVPYYYRAFATNSCGLGWAPTSALFKAQRPVARGPDGLLARQFDSAIVLAQINPISGIEGATEDGVSLQISNIDYAAFVGPFPFITANTDLAIHFTGYFMPPAGPGVYSFGLNHDDQAGLVIDLNDDGVFDDGAVFQPGELVVDGVTAGCCGTRVGQVTLTENRSYRVAIAWRQGAGAGYIRARWAVGPESNFNNMNFINGLTGDFVSDLFPLVSVSNSFATGITTTSAVFNGSFGGTESVFSLSLHWGATDGGTNAAA